MGKEDYSAINRNEILPLATMWTDLECIILHEISQTKDIYFLLSHMNIIIHRYKKTTVITRSGMGQDGSMALRDITYYI